MGYSEPGAGSDLASLSMRAVDQGDHFLINGMKIWTSDAMWGDWIFCLVRTDPDAPKHEGISFLLVDMDQPGVRVRPIRLISGNSPFCETFFEDAIAKKEDLLGELNHGWTVGKRLLQFERSTHGGVNTSGTQRSEDAPRLADIVRGYVGEVNGHIAQREMRERVTSFEMDSHAYRLTQRRAMEEARARAPGSASSIFKMCGANLTQERADIHREVMGFDGLGWEGAPFSDEQTQVTRTWLSSRATTIYGGTNEIQMNIIAKRVLGLPD
jgi:alkylation response protein AidB-like acyl-CoA dehydrogenase